MQKILSFLKTVPGKGLSLLRQWFGNPYFDIVFIMFFFVNIHLLYWNAGVSDKPIYQTMSAQGDLGYFWLDMGLLFAVALVMPAMVMVYFIKRRLWLKELVQLIALGILFAKPIIDYLYNGLQNPVGLFVTNFAILFTMMLIIELVFHFWIENKKLSL